ncbi:MAG: sigma-70 family RNA polymerase sigma factor [Saprospiraceae bacterium]|nr:sigma-70 family RNA polymerase sigma factor [Saprospiraceae bacterium]
MINSNKNTDSTLWLAFKQGDKQAFSALYQNYIADLLTYGYRLTNDKSLIKDSIQDLFLHLWQHRHNLSATDSVRFYLYRSLRNRIIRNIGTQSLTQTVEPDDLNYMALPNQLPFDEEWMNEETRQEQIHKLRNAIETLPKRQQEAIELRYLHDFSLEQIAELMDISNQSVRNTLHRALTALRDVLGGSVGLLFFLMTIYFKKNF